MKKIDELVKKVEYFERLACYGNRSSFLKALAQDSLDSKEQPQDIVPPNTNKK